MMNNSPGDIFNIIFFFISLFGLFCFYVLYYRGKRIKKYLLNELTNSHPEAIEISVDEDCRSKYMFAEGGSYLVRVRINDLNEILVYQLSVNAQINLMRFLVHVQHGVECGEGIYGRGHVARECKSRKILEEFKSLEDLTPDVILLRSCVSTVEVVEGSAFCYYRINGLMGKYPIKEVLSHVI